MTVASVFSSRPICQDSTPLLSDRLVHCVCEVGIQRPLEDISGTTIGLIGGSGRRTYTHARILTTAVVNVISPARGA